MNILDLFSRLGIEFKRHGESKHATEGWVNTDCYLCSRESGKHKLGFPIAFPWLANCWTCGRVSLYAFLIDRGIPQKEVKEICGEIDKGRWQKREHPGKLVIPKGVGEIGPAHRRYLIKRGFDPDEIVKLWDVQGIGISSHLAWRLWIPLINRGETLSWTTRSISDEVTDRYITAKPEEEKEPSKRLLYGLDYARHAAIVVEGPTDVWKVGPGAVCTFGTAFSKAQVLALSRLTKIVICLDSEPAAQRQAEKLAGMLSSYECDVSIVTIDADDPGSAKPKEIKQLRRLLN